MSYESNLEDAVYEVRDYIRTNYDTYLQGINTAKADGVTAEAIKAANIEVRELDPFDTTEYPVMALYPGEPSDISLSAQTLEKDELTLPMTAVIAISAGDSTTQIQKVMRYAEALRQLLRASITDGITWEAGREVNIKVYPATPDEQALKIATVSWTVRTTIA
jgi:hypothetical protein